MNNINIHVHVTTEKFPRYVGGGGLGLSLKDIEMCLYMFISNVFMTVHNSRLYFILETKYGELLEQNPPAPSPLLPDTLRACFLY